MLAPSLLGPRRRGREEREGQVPSCPGTEGSYKACSSGGPSRRAGSTAPAFNVSAVVPKLRRWLPKGCSVELSQLPCGLPATLFLLITSAIEERRTREERAGQLANPPAREGRKPGCRRSSGGSSSRSSNNSSEGHLVSGNPQSRAAELSPDNPAFDSGISLSRQSAALGAALSLYRADTPREEAGHTQKETHGAPGWGVEVDQGELTSRPVLAACLAKK